MNLSTSLFDNLSTLIDLEYYGQKYHSTLNNVPYAFLCDHNLYIAVIFISRPERIMSFLRFKCIGKFLND